jgi:hypothetical protein
MLARRAAAYRQFSQIDTDDKTVEEVVAEIMSALARGSRRLEAEA